MKSAITLLLGPYRLLVDIALVQEVSARMPVDEQCVGYRTWRERNIPIIDLHRLFGLEPPRRVQWAMLADGEGQDAAIYAVSADKIPGLQDMKQMSLHPLPVTLSGVSGLIERVWRADDKLVYLELHFPLRDLVAQMSDEVERCD
jgi:chemotaxis signal transduction protein